MTLRDWILSKYWKFFFSNGYAPIFHKTSALLPNPLGIRESFREIAARRKRVKSCRATSRESVVVKFPHGKAKAEAKALVGSSADFTDVAESEPKKMLPKMTLLDVSPSLPDDEIISGILDKNPQIKE